MTFYKSNGDRVPDHIVEMAEQAKTGNVDRREFLALASVFGASTAMAYGMLGLAAEPSLRLQPQQPSGVLARHRVDIACRDALAHQASV